MRIIRHKILHEGTFKHILRAAQSARRSYRYNGRYWRQVSREEGVRIYCLATYDAAYIRSRVTEYERFLYASLAGGFSGRDSILRPRTRNVYRISGSYRQSIR
jgi:hypothetical protein